MVDFFMNQIYNLRNKGGVELNRLKANLKAIIHRSGTDIEEQVYDSQQQNLMENLNLYMKNIFAYYTYIYTHFGEKTKLLINLLQRAQTAGLTL